MRGIRRFFVLASLERNCLRERVSVKYWRRSSVLENLAALTTEALIQHLVRTPISKNCRQKNVSVTLRTFRCRVGFRRRLTTSPKVVRKEGTMQVAITQQASLIVFFLILSHKF